MCQTIEELDKKNDQAHKELREQLDTTLKEVKGLVNNALKRVDTAYRELSVSSRINTFQKWVIAGMGAIIILLAGWLVILGGNVLKADRVSADAVSNSAKVRYQSYVLLDSIHKEMKLNNEITAQFNSVAFQDTIQRHWNLTLKFFQTDWKNEVEFTHREFNNIKTMQIKIARSELVLKDHENRIKKLEKQ